MSQLVFWFTTACFITFPYKLRGHYASISCKIQGRENRKWRQIFAFDRCVMFLYLISAYSIGCYKDTGRRAISTLEGRSAFLKGRYRRRRDAIRKCFQAAFRRGYRMFALQHQGWCASSRRAHVTYRKYGKSNRCRNGKGGPWANDVYVIRGKNIFFL